MSGGNVFGGGQIDVGNLLGHLSGLPLQAEIEELFVPMSGDPVRRRHTRLVATSDGCVRFDVTEGEAPTVAFVFDSRRGVFSGGLAERPGSWDSQPWSSHIPKLPFAFAATPMAITDATSVEGIACRVSEYEVGDSKTTVWESPQLGIPIRIESSDPTGRKTFRVHSVRFEEPDAKCLP